jgi:hypothetical protein
MAIEAFEKSGFLGLKKIYIVPKKKYSFISPPEWIDTSVDIMTGDKISIMNNLGCNHGFLFFDIKYLEKKEINKENVVVPRLGEKPIRLKWRKTHE